MHGLLSLKSVRVLSVATFIGLAGISQPANALSVGDGSVFRVDFDATTSEGSVSSFLDITVEKVTSTIFNLLVKVTNDTNSPPGGYFDAFGFSVDPNAIALTVANPTTGAFTDDQDSLTWDQKTGFIPGSGVTIEQCVGTGSNCQAANSGLAAGLVDRLLVSMTFASAVSTFDIFGFAGRFARIDANDYDNDGIKDLSLGTPGTITTANPIPVPAALPLFLSALAGFALLGWRRRRAAVGATAT